MNKIDGRSKTVRELLEKVKYNIDYYQREYKWETSHITDLLDDLEGKFLSSYDKKHATLDPHGISLTEHRRRRWQGQLQMDLSEWIPCLCKL